MSASHTTPWTDAEKAHLKQRWLAGASVTEIARELRPRSRNAVIGAAHRMNLPPHVNARPEGSVTRRRVYPARRRSPSQPRASAIVRRVASRAHDPGLKLKPSIAPSTKPILLIHAEAHHCKYIEDETSGPDTFVCGRKVEGNTSWCSHHMEIVFQPEHRRREWAA